MERPNMERALMYNDRQTRRKKSIEREEVKLKNKELPAEKTGTKVPRHEV